MFQVSVFAWFEAFAAHPALGSKLGSQADNFMAHSAKEQATAQEADAASLVELEEWNQKYQHKFKHVFLLCAAGRPASDILATLKQRCAGRRIGLLTLLTILAFESGLRACLQKCQSRFDLEHSMLAVAID
jgi:membrane protein YqaA with SNARE-associated domain